ncbi:hypothetical protein HDU85_002264 [Gaertneriomyces sp. JEL0708]|nr:hypothetical protein HDU85_002264 [Gaertneriomyces sp. JEL0708]
MPSVPKLGFIEALRSLPSYIPKASVYRASSTNYHYTYDVSTKLKYPFQQPTTVPAAIDQSIPTLLILHGSPGGYDSGRWHGCALATFASEEDKDKPFGVLAVSRPGYLGTGPCQGSYSDEADGLYDLINGLGLDRDKIAIMAVSGSGPVALTMRKKYPERVAGLVLMDAVTKHIHIPLAGRVVETLLLGWSPLTNPLGAYLYSVFSSERLPFPIRKFLGDDTIKEIQSDPRVAQFFHSYIIAYTQGSSRRPGLWRDLSLINTLEDRPDWGPIDCPMICMHGAKDSGLDMEHPKYALQAQAHIAEFVKFPEGKHILPLKRTSEMAMGFLWRHVFPRCKGTL